MPASPITRAPAVQTSNESHGLRALPVRRLWVWWHLLSLDAPTVAVAWSWAFARAFNITLPWFALLTLGLGTWCVYVADRLLDGWRSSRSMQLRERHLFYARHRRIFFLALATAFLPLLYFLFLRVARAARIDDGLLAMLGLVYFILIHGPDKRAAHGSRAWIPKKLWIPKEIIVGILFSVATAIPAWSRLHGEPLWMPIVVVLFSGICCWNCIAIQIWEDGCVQDSRRTEPVHPLTAWVGARLQWFAAALSIVAIGVAALAPTQELRILTSLCSLSGVFFLLLHHFHHRMHSRTLRVAADMALLTPLLWIAVVH